MLLSRQAKVDNAVIFREEEFGATGVKRESGRQTWDPVFGQMFVCPCSILSFALVLGFSLMPTGQRRYDCDASKESNSASPSEIHSAPAGPRRLSASRLHLAQKQDDMGRAIAKSEHSVWETQRTKRSSAQQSKKKLNFLRREPRNGGWPSNIIRVCEERKRGHMSGL